MDNQLSRDQTLTILLQFWTTQPLIPKTKDFSYLVLVLDRDH